MIPLTRVNEYVLAVCALGLVTAVRFMLDPWLHEQLAFTPYVAAVTIVGIYAHMVPALVTTVAGGFLADFLFMEPRLQLSISVIDDWIEFGVYLTVAALIIAVAAQLRASRAILLDSKRQLEARSEELRLADRRKDEFISMMAHELRNPLAPIVTAAAVLRNVMHDPARAMAAVEIIDRQAMHLKYLLDDLLDVVRVNTGRITLAKEAVEIGDVVRQCVGSMIPRCEAKQVGLVVPTLTQPIWVSADRGRLVQILDNLLDNACKYTDPGGSAAVSATAADGECAITVTDTGIGIGADALARVFEPFHQADDAPERGSGGLGLGLYLVRTLVEKHGGRVSAHSDGPGRGSAFTVTLPLAPAPAPTEPHRPTARSSTAARRVLIVDDNADAARTLKMALEMDGHAVSVAENGPDGLVLAQQIQPEVALIDLRMPGMSGYEVARRLRERFGDRVRLVAVTGYGQEEHRLLTREAGFDEHLLKPPDTEALAAAIAAAPLWAQPVDLVSGRSPARRP